MSSKQKQNYKKPQKNEPIVDRYDGPHHEFTLLNLTNNNMKYVISSLSTLELELDNVYELRTLDVNESWKFVVCKQNSILQKLMHFYRIPCTDYYIYCQPTMNARYNDIICVCGKSIISQVLKSYFFRFKVLYTK